MKRPDKKHVIELKDWDWDEHDEAALGQLEEMLDHFARLIVTKYGAKFIEDYQRMEQQLFELQEYKAMLERIRARAARQVINL
jgi:hypothetical protein